MGVLKAHFILSLLWAFSALSAHALDEAPLPSLESVAPCPLWVAKVGEASMRVRMPTGYWNDPVHQKQYLAWLAVELDLRTAEDWLAVGRDTIGALGGWPLLKQYGGSAPIALSTLLPELDIHPWMFPQAPQGYWKKIENRVAYAKWLGKKLGYEKPEDWYQLDYQTVVDNHGVFIDSNKLSYTDLARYAHPGYAFHRFLFKQAPHGYWKKQKNVRAYLSWLAPLLGFQSPRDWLGLTADQLKHHHGHGLLDQAEFNASPSAIVRFAFPEFGLEPWEFTKVPSGFMDDAKNRRAYMDWLGKKLGFSKKEDYLRLRQEDLAGNYGYSILDRYGNSASAVVMAVYPEWKFVPWDFVVTQQRISQDPAVRREYMNWLGKRLGYEKPEDWYALTQDTLHENKGLAVQRANGGILSALVQEHFPDYEFLPWKFVRVPDGFWAEPVNRRRYMTWLGKQLGFERPEDWYALTGALLMKHDGRGALREAGESPMRLVLEHFPNFSFKQEEFYHFRKGQKQLLELVRKKFQGEKIEYEFKHPDLRFAASGRSMEIDIWLPDRRLAFEYQGEQHFRPVASWGGQKTLEAVRARDREKRERFSQAGIRLIEIPYTWDATPEAFETALAYSFVPKF